ncbi:hypothetical protein K491DRAFT_673040 [Lophiostoma macrostomum CBS 122681]|uniref:Aminoglycoside phosphotransferase domain-containing protein n=1 Tax=Lophiostoma macrostomum CBS 122681 TaxID=1314788 RepID=A0A6A6TRT4_9PLEO|nr:hypothetical protein K491DRAFT_673040 [Lophiostoma macrostomum CBS 122681]
MAPFTHFKKILDGLHLRPTTISAPVSELMKAVPLTPTVCQWVSGLFSGAFFDQAPQREEPISACNHPTKDGATPDLTENVDVDHQTAGDDQAEGIGDQEMTDADSESEDHDQNTGELQTKSSTDDDYVDRRDFDTIKAIQDSAFEKLLLQHIDPEGKLDVNKCQVEEHDGGSYHYVVFLSVEGHGRFVVKVPFSGTATWWQEGDAYNLRSEAQTMNFIRRNTSVPIPEVIAFDDSLDNAIAAPYILMRAIEGRVATHAWYGRTPNGQLDKSNADNPSLATVQQRKRFLKNLAYTMAELRHLRFDKIGMLNFDGNAGVPEVGPWFEDMQDGQQLKEVPAYESSKDFFQSKIDYVKDKCDGQIDDLAYGIMEVLKLAFGSSPISSSKEKASDIQESFVLTHNDLDLQNIYVDDNFNIVGIIDWDLTVTAPRCVGFSSFPVFLREDWDPDYDLETAKHMPWSLAEYRMLYTGYMKQATSGPDGLGDGKYTSRSHMYYAAYSVGMYSAATQYFVERICKELPLLRSLDHDTFLENFGGESWTGSDRARTVLKRGLEMLFSAESE